MPEITEVVTKSNRPVIVSFQNSELLTGNEPNLTPYIFKDRNTNKRILGVAHIDMVYVGEVENNDKFYNNFLVCHDKNTNKIKLIQVDSCTVLPFLEKGITGAKSPVSENANAALKKEFGSKRAKRYTEQQERLKTNVESVKEQLEQTVDAIEIPEQLNESVTEEQESAYRPKINRDASTKEGVYLLSDLIPPDVLESLEQVASELLEGSDLETIQLLPFIASSISTLKISNLPNEYKRKKCQIFLYLHYLAKYMCTPIRLMTKKSVICDCSNSVSQHIKQNFSINGLRPPSMKDKSLCYILVLYLLAKDYQIDVEVLVRDLKVSLKKLLEYCRVLAFSTSSSHKTTVVLKLPLPPPFSRFLNRKRK